MRLAFLAFTVVYGAVSVWMMSIKPFWMDEVYTFYVSGAASMDVTLRMVADYVDHQPPPFFLLTRLSLLLPLRPEIAARLASLFGYWLMCWSLYRIVSLRTCRLYGAVALTAALPVLPYVYAFEARPYAIVVGACALALWGWMEANQNHERKAALALCAFSLAVAVSMNYYAILFIAPLAAGQIAKTWVDRRIDWPVWFSLASGGAVCLLYLPHVFGSLEIFPANGWSAPDAWSFVDIYAHSVGAAGLSYFACSALGLAAALMHLRFRRVPVLPLTKLPPIHETVAVLALCLLPFLGQLVAIKTRVIHGRYVMAATIGIIILFAWVAFRLAGGNRFVGYALIGLATLFFAVNVETRRNVIRDQVESRLRVSRWLAADRESLPIVVDDPLLWFEMEHYEQGPLQKRLHYLIDFEASARYAQTPFLGKGMLRMVDYRTMHVLRRAQFQRQYPRFLLLETGSVFAYLRQPLARQGAKLTPLSQLDGNSLSLVEVQ